MTSPSEVDALLAHVDAYATELGTHWEGCEANHPRCLLHKLAQIVREQRDITDAAQARIAELERDAAKLRELIVDMEPYWTGWTKKTLWTADVAEFMASIRHRIDAAMEKQK